MSSPSATPNAYPYLNEPKWSRSEKAIAHKVFDAAQERELQQVIQEAKQKAGQIREPADLWDLEHCLTQHRKELDRKYDYRYSQLDLVFRETSPKKEALVLAHPSAANAHRQDR